MRFIGFLWPRVLASRVRLPVGLAKDWGLAFGFIRELPGKVPRLGDARPILLCHELLLGLVDDGLVRCLEVVGVRDVVLAVELLDVLGGLLLASHFGKAWSWPPTRTTITCPAPEKLLV